MKCPNTLAVKTLGSSMDRLNEAQWYVELMQEHYHCAAKFRWALSSFLRAIKEVSQIISMEVQVNNDLKEWYKEKRKEISKDPIISYLSKQRDIVVHQKALETASKGTIGFTRNKKLKLGLGISIDPSHDSEEAILTYINFAAKESDFLGILYTEHDGSGEFTAVVREWCLDEHLDTEVTLLCKHAWEMLIKVVVDLGCMLGADLFAPELKMKPIEDVTIQMYNPEWIKKQYDIAMQAHKN